MKSLALVALLLIGLLAAKGLVIIEGASRNLAVVEVVKIWSKEQQDLSQIVCDRHEQQVSTGRGDSYSRPSGDSYAAIVNAARSAYFSGDCENALAYWTLAMERNPKDKTVAAMRFLSSGLDMEMLAPNVSSEDMATLLSGLGAHAEQNNMEQEADHWFTNAFELEPSRAVANHLLPYSESPADRERLWLRVSEATTVSDADYWWALGQQAELTKEWKQALEAYSVGVDISPDPYSFLMRQGSLMLRLSLPDEAEDVFRKAAFLRPNRSQPYLQLGGIHSEIGNHAKAKDWYIKAVEAEPGKYRPNYLLGLSYYRLDDNGLAERYLRKAAEIDPQNSSVFYYLARAKYREGRREQALEHLNNAVLLDEGLHWTWLVLLGDWREASNDHKGALEAYYQALDLQPDRLKIVNRIQQIEAPSHD